MDSNIRDIYEKKFRDMQQYLPYLEERIERMKKIKLKIAFPDPDREAKLGRLQTVYSILKHKDTRKKTTLQTLEKFETTIKKMQEQEFLDSRQSRKDGFSKKDPNPYHNPDIYRPGSSCSNSSSTSSSRKIFDDTPASPSPPRSPPPHSSLGSSSTSTMPIIIPTERRSRYVPIGADSPPRSRSFFNRSPSPAIPNVVPITRVDVKQMGPQEWDTDEEDNSETTSARPEIVVPTGPSDVSQAAKMAGDKFPCKKEEIKPVKHNSDPPHLHHPSDNIPMVHVNSLGGSRRLKSVIEKTNLLNARSINHLLSSHRPVSPLHTSSTDEVGLRSPEPPDHLVRRSPSQHPAFSPSRRDSRDSGGPAAAKVPPTPSLLLNAPVTNSRPPVALEDIVNLMDDDERSQLRRGHEGVMKSGIGGRPQSARLTLPNSSPSMMSPRSEPSAMSPCMTDPRLSGDPRSRPGADPRGGHGVDPRNHGILQPPPPPPPPPPSAMSNDPRSQHGSAVPRYADNYERHKRSMPRDAAPEPPPTPMDYAQHRQQQQQQQQRMQMEQYGPDNPGMMTQPLHGVVNAGPGMYNPHNQMGPMSYGDYHRMGPSPDPYGGPGGMQSPQQQQQWNGPPHPHMQAQSGYPMGPQGMRGPPEPQGWQNQGPPMYQDMQPPQHHHQQQQQHPMMNGDGRMGGGYPGPMQGNMGRSNVPHIQPLMSANPRYSTYQDSRSSYDMAPGGDFGQQRIRPSWSNSNQRNDPSERFGGRPSTPFNRPPNPAWGGANKDAPPSIRSNPNANASRDPRMAASADRDPRTQQRQESHRPPSPHFGKDVKEVPMATATGPAKGPPPGKEVHPNKLAKQAAEKEKEKEAVSKKRPDIHKSHTDTHKSKDKDKDKDKHRDRDKDRHKGKSKSKSGETMKSPLTDLYGAIDAKKAVQGPGLQKFKIPKKRPSVDARPEPTPATEDNWDDDDVVTSSSASHEPASKHPPPESSTTSKKSSKSSDKDKDKDKEKSSGTDKESSTEPSDTQERKKSSKKLKELSKDDLSSLVKELMKKLKKKKKGGKSSSTDDDEDEGSSSDERRPTSSSPKRKVVTKKRRKAIIESSSDESEESSATPPMVVPVKKEKEKERKKVEKAEKAEKVERVEAKRVETKKLSVELKKLSVELKDDVAEKRKEMEKEKEKEMEIGATKKRSCKAKSKKIIEDSDSGKEANEALPESSLAPKKNSVPEEAEAEAEATTTADATAVGADAAAAPVKAKPKRRFRELDMLQEDLKSSWICDGAMKATGSRTCSQKNKPQEQQQQEQGAEEEVSAGTTAGKGAAASKMKKPQPPKSKPGPKPKKATSESSLLVSSDSEEDDLPLSRRSEGLDTSTSSTATSSTAAAAAPKSRTAATTTKTAAGKKARAAKSVAKVPPPLFDSSSNDSFNLDASAVEPATDISLHPDTSSSEKTVGKAKGGKKAGKKAAVSADAAAESSSDESFVSNASSLLLDTSSKLRDNNQELLDDVMAELATNPKYSVAKKKAAKKKKNNWQMGILSKKKKKKAGAIGAAANKGVDESTSHESTADTSIATDASQAGKETDTTTASSASDKNLDRTESLDKLNDEEDIGWRTTTTTATTTTTTTTTTAVATPTNVDVHAQDDEDLSSRVDAEALIGYTLNVSERNQCLLCPFYRKNIVHHYKMLHPRKEVLISRLPVEEAAQATEESERLDFENNEFPSPDKDIGKYSCRFCSFTTKGVDSCARESFYEHCTNHTGEYRFACQNCSYEAVAKGSIRTHYYKECRKITAMKNFNEAVVECPIPSEDRIYGYLCEKCNFVQLKRSNVELHVKRWHGKDGSEVKVVKIDMSLNVKREEKVKTEGVDAASIVPHKVELKDEKEVAGEAETVEVPDIKENVVAETAIEPEAAITTNTDEITVTMEATVEKLEKPEKLEKANSNLSAFVCADELTDKDVEIQNERKKKMQEIVENIGIKVDKDEGQKRISIIDQLKNKIDSSRPSTEAEAEPEAGPTAGPGANVNAPEKVETPDGEQSTLPAETAEDGEDPLRMPEQESKEERAEGEGVPEVKTTAEVLLPEAGVKIKDEPEKGENEKEDKAAAKMKDPLDAGYDHDSSPTSDGEPSVSAVQYDSDSSQSEHEEATDVSSILLQGGAACCEMRSPSQGPMMTTIQRLAAQLQQKPALDTPSLPEAEPETLNVEAPVRVKTERSSASPRRTGDDMAILSPSRIKREVKREPLSPTHSKEEDPKIMDENSQSSSSKSPKTFIRIRRISGDKLSKGTELETSLNNENDQPTSMATIEPIDSSTNDDDTGFLKIANVVSLAEKETDNQIVSHIRKAVETSPKAKGLSVLKKPSSFILKRVDPSGSVITSSGETVKLIPLNISNSRPVSKSENYISISGQPAMAIKIDSKGVAVPLSMGSSGSATTTLVGSANQPFKILKIATPEQVSVAIKLKSANVYEKMLKDDKLMHMFKCMGRDCCFTTSTEQAFHKHLRLHEDDPGNSKASTEPKDYFKCAYCYIDCKNYDELMFHLKKQHIFCRYCCKYCFYRAFAHSYVEIHQKNFHQLKRVHILSVSEELVQLPPPPKRLERKQIIKPYVCVHECNKYFFIPEAFVLHLNMHHANIVANFKCHICQISVSTVDNLIEHYKQHGYFKYHCMYCTHGSAVIRELHNHLSSAHYNQPPYILERCLPREISKNLSAIDQLRVRDVDAIYRQRRGTYEDEHNGKVAIPPLIRSSVGGGGNVNAIQQQQQQPAMTTKIGVVPKENSNNSNNAGGGGGGASFVPLTNLDGGVSNIRILDARSLSTGSSTPTSLLNIGKNIKVTVTDSPLLSKDASTLHTMAEDDNNEFVSTNLLDHTDLLSGNKSKKPAKVEENKSVDYDSDIEIIGDYPNASPTAADKKEQSPAPKDTIKEESTDDQKQAPSQIFAATEPDSISTSETTSSSASSASALLASGLSNLKTSTTDPTGTSSPTGRFLTLDDVRGSGFEGRELYRCGVETCRYGAETANDLRLHMLQCSPSDEDGLSDSAALYCLHCGPASKRFGKPTFFIDHLKTHGLKRFSCAVCNARFAVQSQAQSHIRAKHKLTSSRIVPADPMNPASEGLFVVHPIKTAEKLKNKKLAKSPEKAAPDAEKTTFSPNELDKLPLQAIFNRAVQCALCPYSNKVRTNVLRHLQAHLKDESVPDSSPVNPVPCLDKKERMFDKMVNLASSSHENGRMSGGGGPNAGQKEAAKSEEDEGLPKYVPENKRFVCGAPECNYLTVGETMLRHHLKALHSDELYFRCPHCPTAVAGGQDQAAQNIPHEKMAVHLKMHDSRLYKCSHCIYHHYHRHVVERHLTDKHPENRPFVKVIRELQPTADPSTGEDSRYDQQPQQQQQQQHQSSGSSSFAGGQEAEETEAPDPDGNTWKCNLCDFKCVYKTAVQLHATNVHDEKCQFKCKACGFKNISKLTFDQHLATKHSAEPNVEWIAVYQRIKGLKKSEPTEPAVPQDEPFDTTPLWRRDMPRIRHIRGILLEEEEENESSRASSGAPAKRKSDLEGAGAGGKPAKVKASKSASLEESIGKSPEAKRARTSVDDPLRGADGNYGPYGKPQGDLYTCTVCNTFRSRYKADFRDHLYRDLKYFRWPCKAFGCEYKGVNRTSLFKHYSNRHSSEGLEPEATLSNEQLEEWVATVIKTQHDMMKSNALAPVPTTPVEVEAEAEESEEDDLVIDMKEEEQNEVSEDETVSYEVLPAPLICKHCNMTFNKWRGFKRHVQLKHLKRLGFLCPYCDRSTNSETVMLQHVRAKHRELPEKVLENPNPQTGELSAEFWEREYGLVVPKRPKKRKRKDDGGEEGGTAKVDHDLPCDKCDFRAMTNAGMKSHMRTHETRVKQKCSYCTFISFNSSEMRQHWEVNHSHLEFKVEEAIVTSAAMDIANANIRAAKKTKLEEERKATVYYCYYCDMGSTSLDAIRSHWRMMHMDDSKSAMFKYKEHSETRVKCAYCAEPGTKSILVNHIWQKHGTDKAVLLVERDEDGWMCKWCKEEFFTSKEEIDYHQKMFHSHLRMNLRLVQRTFSCKQCTFDTLSLENMQRHAKSHINVYKCKHCNSMFKTFSAVKSHFKLDHPDKEAETRTITGEDLSKEIEVIVGQSAIYSDVQLTPVKVSPAKPSPTSPRLAKKSTTKQSVLVPMKPFPAKIKAVARKSTNPLPRYPAGIVFETEETTSYASHYARPNSPVDLANLTTTMAIGGLKMKVNCAKLAEMLNIQPTLRIRDFMKERGRDHR